MNELTTIGIPVLAGIVAGVTWSLLGLWSKYRSTGEKSIDSDKMKKNLLVGAGTGFASYIYALGTGTAIPLISSFEGFVAAAGAFFTLVVVVDKLLIARDDVLTDEG